MKNQYWSFSKANGFRHSSAIGASLPVYEHIGYKNFYDGDAGVFNENQLTLFQVVIWNNVSGKVLTDDQRIVFKNWIEGVRGFIGIHAAGDDSHQWVWYESAVIQTHFSHHNISPYLDTATLHLNIDVDNHQLSDVEHF